MTDRERLIELIEQCSCQYSPPCTGECGECHNVEMYDRNIEHIADHLLANGVIVPPCKVGERLYEIVKMPKHTFISEFPMISEPYQVIYRNIIGGYSCIPFEKIGKTVFLTREEAEKALEGMQ